MSGDRFEKLEHDRSGQAPKESAPGSPAKRFRRWLEFKGEKRPKPLEVVPDKAAPVRTPDKAPETSNAHRPQPAAPVLGVNGEALLAAKRTARLAREEELQAARERARRARNTLLWIVGGLGAVGFLVYLLSNGGIGGFFAELIIMIIAAVVLAIFRGGRIGRGRWGRGNGWDD